MTPVVADMVKEMVDRIVAEFNPRRVYLFGSHAWGNPAPDSDIDLMVVVDTVEDSPTRMARRTYQVLARRSVPVDILFRGLESFVTPGGPSVDPGVQDLPRGDPSAWIRTGDLKYRYPGDEDVPTSVVIHKNRVLYEPRP